MSSAEKTSELTGEHGQLKEAERKFQKSCNQIFLLNKSLEDMQIRYVAAKTENFRCFRYNLRLKLAVVEGTRNMYYEYAYKQAEMVADLRQKLFGQLVHIVTSDDESDMEAEADEYST